MVRAENRRKRLSWCLGKRRWVVDGSWNKVIFWDESQIVIGTNNSIYIWRKRGEGCRTDLILSTQNRTYQVLIRRCIYWYGVGTLTCINGKIKSEKYKTILEDNIWPVIARHFPENQYLFQDDNAPVHRYRVLQEYKAKNNLKSISWPAQSTDLNIIENIWLYVKRKLAYRYCFIHSNEDLFREMTKFEWTFRHVLFEIFICQFQRESCQ